jgi:putative tricarboxylic transport membrane protein
VKTSVFSIWVVLGFGLVGYAMKRLNLPVAPLVLGLVIGPLFEKALVQTSALAGEDGIASLVLTSPAAVVVLLAAVALVAGPPLASAVRRRTGEPETVPTGRKS